MESVTNLPVGSFVGSSPFVTNSAVCVVWHPMRRLQRRRASQRGNYNARPVADETVGGPASDGRRRSRGTWQEYPSDYSG